MPPVFVMNLDEVGFTTFSMSKEKTLIALESCTAPVIY